MRMRKNHVCVKVSSVIFLLFSIFLKVQGKPGVVTNTLEEIKATENKIILSPVRIWGEDDTEDINQVFRFPAFVAIDSKGEIYIVDSANNRIQVFTPTGKYIRTIGRRGEGPSDTLMPGKIAFTKNDNIILADLFNFRIQILDKLGKYIGSFRTGKTMPVNFSLSPEDDLLLYMPKKNNDCEWVVSLFDLKGNLKKEVCTFPCITGTANREQILSSIDEKGNIFISYLRVPVFQRFSTGGKLIGTVSYEPSIKVPEYGWTAESPTPLVTATKDEKPHPILVECTLDAQGRVFVILYNRPRLNEERFFMTGIGERKPKKFPEITDLFRLVVFNAAGKVIASKILPVYCDQINVYGNRLFLIDTYRFMKIYEYSFEL